MFFCCTGFQCILKNRALFCRFRKGKSCKFDRFWQESQTPLSALMHNVSFMRLWQVRKKEQSCVEKTKKILKTVLRLALYPHLVFAAHCVRLDSLKTENIETLPIYLCIHSFRHSFIHSFIHLFIHSFNHSCIYSFIDFDTRFSSQESRGGSRPRRAGITLWFWAISYSSAGSKAI